MPNPIVAIATSAVGSTVASVAGAKKAAKATTQSTTDQIDSSERIFAQQRDDAAPWREAGKASLVRLQKGLADGSFNMDDFKMEADPGYQFRLEEGQKAIDRTNAIGGNFLSGEQVKDAIRYSSGMASQEYGAAYNRAAAEKGNAFNREAAIAGVGQTAVNETNANAGRMGDRIGNAFAVQGSNLANINSSMYGNIAGAGNQAIENYLTYKQAG